MSVGYYNRLLLTGPRTAIDLFRQSIRITRRRSAPGREPWKERVPFSFQRLYELAPTAARIEPDIPGEAFDISVWPIRRRPNRQVELRYQFQTRNLEVAPLLRPLARKFPKLVFVFVVLCIDDYSVESYHYSAGKMRRWEPPEKLRERIWDRARAEFHLEGDALYDDDDADSFVGEALLDEALAHWLPAPGKREKATRQFDWWNRRAVRLLDDEQDIAMEQLMSEE